ncbi:MAG: ribose-phosphate diphosphokinase, partial [Oligoflexia bacterium]|nr:ribose-phosphate diphosphokinase [Oligoflexia bacterium]
LEYIQKELVGEGKPIQDPICVSPDSGGVERVRHYAKKLGCDLAMIDKRRVAHNVAKAGHVVGHVKNKDVMIVDDIIDTAGTLVEAIKTLKEHGARKIFACATHPIFSPPACERISNCKELDGVIVADTIPLSKEWQSVGKVKVLSVAEILGRAIHYTFNNDSVSSLFV